MNLRVLNSGISSAAARHKEPWHGSLAPSLAKSQRPPVKSKLGARWLLQAGARGVQWVQSWSHGDFIRNPAKGTKNISWILWFYLYHTITDHMSWLYNIICIYIYHIYIYNHIYISYRFGMWYFGSFWVDLMEEILHSAFAAFAVRLGILVQLPKSLQLLQHHSEGRSHTPGTAKEPVAISANRREFRKW